MDDGSYTGSGIKLYTDAFSLVELDLLIKALDKNFKITEGQPLLISIIQLKDSIVYTYLKVNYR